jgi:hypothetical protein
MRELPRDLAVQLLDDARLKKAEVEDRLRRAIDADYWRRLASGLHAGDEVRELDASPAAPDALAGAADAMREDGVFHLTRAVAGSTVARLNEAIDRVIAAGWPPVFAFVYDEFWLCARLPAIVRVVTDVLGPDPAQIPHVWTHIVHPTGSSAGWSPHVDGVGRRRVSCWVALTEATLENGCMHVVPRSLAPPHLAQRFDGRSSFTGAELMATLHAATAMPASAGDVLGWTFDVVHWGGRSRGGRTARRSLSFEYIAASEVPRDDERPLVPLADPPPPLAERLHAIATGVLEFRKYEPLLRRFEDLATRLRDACAVASRDMR